MNHLSSTVHLKNYVVERLTGIIKVNCHGQLIYFSLFENPDLKHVNINTKIKSVACIQPYIKKVT